MEIQIAAIADAVTLHQDGTASALRLGVQEMTVPSLGSPVMLTVFVRALFTLDETEMAQVLATEVWSPSGQMVGSAEGLLTISGASAVLPPGINHVAGLVFVPNEVGLHEVRIKVNQEVRHLPLYLTSH